MKLKITLLMTLLFSITVFSQDTDLKLEIDVINIIKSSEIIVNKGKHVLKIKNFDKIEEIKMEKNFKVEEAFKSDDLAATKGFVDVEIFNEQTFELDFKDNTIYTFTIKRPEDPITSTYIFKSISKKSWTTTFGANGIFLINTSSYKTLKSSTDIYTVIEYKSEKRIEYIPSLMFTFMNKSRDFSLGYTGGIGFDLEQISVFCGISLGIGQNIILTGGVAFNQQEKLNSTYSIGQEVDTALTTENLTTRQYRFNPFVGISFRLDNNRFK